MENQDLNPTSTDSGKMEDNGYRSVDEKSFVSVGYESNASEPSGTCSCTCWNMLFKGRFNIEVLKNLSISWGLILISYSTTLMPPICTMFAGHLGEIELDAVALANSVIIMFGTTVVLGLSTACDTFFTQAYGKGEFRSVGIYLQRSLAIHFIVLILVCALFVNVGPLLALIGEPPEVSRLAGIYVVIYIPGLFAMCFFIICTKYLACQDIVLPNAMIGLAGLVINAILQYLFLFYWTLGVPGSALAQDIACVAMAIFIVLYIYYSKIYKDTWRGFDRALLLDWGAFIKLGFNGVIMFCLEYWVWEIIILLSGLLGTFELAAQTVFFMIEGLFLSIGIGFGDAAAVRVGLELGAGQPINAKVAARVGIFLIVSLSLVISLLIGTLRYELPKLFTTNQEVIDMSAALLPFAVYYVPLNNTVLSAEGVFRGTGKQAVGAVIIFVAYYCVAVPIGVPLMFLTPLENAGSWWGMCVGITLSCICFLTYIEVFIDWDKEAQLALERISEENDLCGDMQDVPNMTQSFDESSALISESKGSPFTSCNGVQGVADRSAVLSGSSRAAMVNRSLVLKRILTVMGALLILTIAIICRALIPAPETTITASTLSPSVTYYPA